MRIEHGSPGRFRVVLEGTGLQGRIGWRGTEPGVVDEDRWGTERSDNVGDDLVERLAVGHVSTVERHGAAFVLYALDHIARRSHDVARCNCCARRGERADVLAAEAPGAAGDDGHVSVEAKQVVGGSRRGHADRLPPRDRKSTRLNSSHLGISYAV